MQIVSDDETRISVSLTKLDTQAEAAFTEAVGTGVALEFKLVRNSLVSSLALEDKLTSLMPALQLEGLGIVSYWTDVTDGLLDIGVNGIDQTVVSTLDELLGAVNISIEPEEPITLTYSRTSDASPWYGGDAIYVNPGCTSRFSIKVGSASELLTAAHCFVNGKTVLNGLKNDSGGITGSSAPIGTVNSRNLVNGEEDVELISASGSPNIWIGTPTSSTTNPVSGYETPQVGMTVDNNGAYSGSVESTIAAINTCINVTEPVARTICGIAHSTSTSVANETGDSGGPISRFYNGALYALGTDTAATSARVVSCTYNTSQKCFNDLYFEQMPDTLSLYGATLNHV